MFCELGQGGVDFPAVAAWLEGAARLTWGIVEQDVLPGMGAPEGERRRNRDICGAWDCKGRLANLLKQVSGRASLRSKSEAYHDELQRRVIMSDILNVGIIGAGRIGKVHAATLAYRIPQRTRAWRSPTSTRPPHSRRPTQLRIPESPTTTARSWRTRTSRRW